MVARGFSQVRHVIYVEALPFAAFHSATEYNEAYSQAEPRFLPVLQPVCRARLAADRANR
jgi:hypothetical protein